MTRSITDVNNNGMDFYVGGMKNLVFTSYLWFCITNHLQTTVNYTAEYNSKVESFELSARTSTNKQFSGYNVILDSSYSFRNQGMHIHSDGPTSLFVLNYRSHTIGIYSAYPHQVFPITEYQYYAVSIRAPTNAISEILLVGNMDNTTIIITPTADVVLPTDIHSADSPDETVFAKTTKLIKLNRLQTLLIGAVLVDLSGTSIVSDKPLTVISGHECGTQPYDFGGCDHVSIQIPPTVTWGKTFILTPHKGRTSGQYFKLIASENTTTVMHNCHSGISTIEFAFAGDVDTIYTNYTTYCYLESDKPLLVTQIMHGRTNEGGDPAFSTVLPTDRYNREIMFYMQNTQFYHDYINIIATEQDTMIMDGSALSLSWKEIRDLNNEVVGYAAQKSIVTWGGHVMITSANNITFGILVYGFSSYIGYSYTAGIAGKAMLSLITIHIHVLVSSCKHDDAKTIILLQNIARFYNFNYSYYTNIIL